MVVSKRKQEENLRTIGGFTGFLHKMVMFLTYPFRKPMRCIFLVAFLLALAYFVPILCGVQKNDVYNWYVDRFNDVNEKIVLPHTGKGTDVLVEPDNLPTVKNVGRQAFGVAIEQNTQAVDILAQEAGDVVNIDDIRRASDEAEPPHYTMSKVIKSEPSQPLVKKKTPVLEKTFDYTEHYGEFSGLVYLDEPLVIEGEAKVHNANELTVNETFMFLYGIFSNPRDGRGVKAGVFLKNLLKGEKVKCLILAYTQDEKIATAECYLGEYDLNQLMVYKGYSDQVSAR